MALTFDKTINLTAYDKNPSPKFVRQLSIIHEATDGELVQYYVLPSSMTEEDKNTHAIGIYDEENKSWSIQTTTKFSGILRDRELQETVWRGLA